MRLIDADALIGKTVIGGRRNNKTIIRYIVTNIVLNAPTVDAEPVRHGYWIEVYDDKTACKCSCCGHEYNLYEEDINGYPYCANCGAKMDEERKEE